MWLCRCWKRVGSFQPDALAQEAEQLEGTFTLTLLIAGTTCILCGATIR